VSAQFFRVDGADQETGEETYLVLQAPTKPQAERLAREQGLLISAVRIARPDDWSAPPVPPAPVETPPQFELESPALQESEPMTELHYAVESATDPSPFVDAQSPAEPVPQPLEPAPALPAVPASTGGSSAGAVVLGCIGGALLLGGVLALVLALWPEYAVRNELQQFDFRLHELSQTILGGVLVLGGLIIFVLAVICHLLSKRIPSP
jgi:hypothetical protein